MSFQLKRGDEVIDGFRVLEPICEKQEYAIYRGEDGRYAICITADLKEVWELDSRCLCQWAITSIVMWVLLSDGVGVQVVHAAARSLSG